MDAELLMNIMWTMLGAFLVFFMQAGFAMVETGFTRAKNSGNILMKNMMDLVIGSIFFFLIGFAFMFGSDNAVIGTKGFFNIRSLADENGMFNSLPIGVFIFFYLPINDLTNSTRLKTCKSVICSPRPI